MPSPGQQLGTNQKKLNNILGTKIDYNLGIIAATSSIDPISSVIIPGDDDGKVALKNMKIEGMGDYIEVNSSHTFMVRNKEVIAAALQFVRLGKFKKNRL